MYYAPLEVYRDVAALKHAETGGKMSGDLGNPEFTVVGKWIPPDTFVLLSSQVSGARAIFHTHDVVGAFQGPSNADSAAAAEGTVPFYVGTVDSLFVITPDPTVSHSASGVGCPRP
jgi:hypothetical protein